MKLFSNKQPIGEPQGGLILPVFIADSVSAQLKSCLVDSFTPFPHVPPHACERWSIRVRTIANIVHRHRGAPILGMTEMGVCMTIEPARARLVVRTPRKIVARQPRALFARYTKPQAEVELRLTPFDYRGPR